MKQYKNFTQKQIKDFIKKHHLTHSQEIKDLHKVIKLYDKALDGDTLSAKELLNIIGE